MRSLIIVLAALAFASGANAAPNCTKGVPCGNACIAKGKVCHVGQAQGAAAHAQGAVQGAAHSAQGAVSHGMAAMGSAAQGAGGAMAASATSAAHNAAATAGKALPTCTPGKTKLCGKACIPVSKTCHA